MLVSGLSSGAAAAAAWAAPRTARAATPVVFEATETGVRESWLDLLERVAEPVLSAASRRELRKAMPVEAMRGLEAERAVGTHLEALGRLLAGIAPWLELEPSPGEAAGARRTRETATPTTPILKG